MRSLYIGCSIRHGLLLLDRRVGLFSLKGSCSYETRLRHDASCIRYHIPHGNLLVHGSSICSPRGSLRTILATISPFVTLYRSASRPLIEQRSCLPHEHFQDSDVAKYLLGHVVPALMFSHDTCVMRSSFRIYEGNCLLCLFASTWKRDMIYF